MLATMLDVGRIHRSAEISGCGRYRYRLNRQWGEFCCERESVVGWVMLNPSTADAESDDQTIRKCMAFSQRWGYSGMFVVNLFAWRATDPRELLKADEPIGPDNWSALCRAKERGAVLVCAWGNGPAAGWRRFAEHERDVRKALWPGRHLGLTGAGHPRHPLYLPLATELQLWRDAA